MKGIDGGEDFKAAFVVAEFAGQLEQAFVGLNAAIAKEAFARADQLHERLGQPALRLLVIKVGGVDEPAGLLHERLSDRRVGMAEGTDGDSAAKIEVALA